MERGVFQTNLGVKSNTLIVWGLSQLLQLNFVRDVLGWRCGGPQGCFLPSHFTSLPILWLTHLDTDPGWFCSQEVRWHSPLQMSLGFSVSSVQVGGLMVTLS